MKSTPCIKNAIWGVQEPWFRLKKKTPEECRVRIQPTKTTHSFDCQKWNKIGFPYFDLFDKPMAIEGSATFSNGESGTSTAAADVTEISIHGHRHQGKKKDRQKELK